MFHAGAPRLLSSPGSVLPCRPRDDDRIILEGYPALPVRAAIGRRSYKNDTRSKQTPERAAARRDLVSILVDDGLVEQYGVRVRIERAMREVLIDDPTGDYLDATLCALQAAWAWTRRERASGGGWGIPAEAPGDEGWIVDPAGLMSHREEVSYG